LSPSTDLCLPLCGRVFEHPCCNTHLPPRVCLASRAAAEPTGLRQEHAGMPPSDAKPQLRKIPSFGSLPRLPKRPSFGKSLSFTKRSTRVAKAGADKEQQADALNTPRRSPSAPPLRPSTPRSCEPANGYNAEEEDEEERVWNKMQMEIEIEAQRARRRVAETRRPSTEGELAEPPERLLSRHDLETEVTRLRRQLSSERKTKLASAPTGSKTAKGASKGGAPAPVRRGINGNGWDGIPTTDSKAKRSSPGRTRSVSSEGVGTVMPSFPDPPCDRRSSPEPPEPPEPPKTTEAAAPMQLQVVLDGELTRQSMLVPVPINGRIAKHPKEAPVQHTASGGGSAWLLMTLMLLLWLSTLLLSATLLGAPFMTPHVHLDPAALSPQQRSLILSRCRKVLLWHVCSVASFG